MVTITSFANCSVCKRKTEHLNLYLKDKDKEGKPYSFLTEQVCVECLPPNKKLGISLAIHLLEKEIYGITK